MFGKTVCRFAPVVNLYIHSSTDSADWCGLSVWQPVSQISFQQFVKLDEFIVSVSRSFS